MKDSELARLQGLLKDRKELLDRASALNVAKSTQPNVAAQTLPPAAHAYDMATDMRYEQLNNEIKSIKV